MSTPSGCTNVVAYVPPAQGIKSSVDRPHELQRTQATETESAATNPTG